jgi:hypothetical protein
MMTTVLFVGTLGFYVGVNVPNLQRLFPSPPPTEATGNLLSYLFRPRGPIGSPPQGKERDEILGVVAATNTICIVLLVGIVVLQIGEWYVKDKLGAGEEDELDEAAARTTTTTTTGETLTVEERKTQ